MWYWSYVDGLKPKFEKPALRFGTLVHKALEERYPPGVKRGPHPAETFERLYEEELERARGFGFKDEDGTWHDAGELGIAMMNHFVDEYGKDDEWRVIASEKPFRTLIRRTPKVQYKYAGIIDGVWQHRGTKELWLNDWKTAKSISTGHLKLDDQPGAYWTFAPDYLRQQGILKPNQELRGIIFTFMRKAKPDPRPRNAEGHCLNKDGTVSKTQPTAYFQRVHTRRSEIERENHRRRALAELKEITAARAGKQAVFKAPGAINCAGCAFRDMCELHEAGMDWEFVRNRTMRKWDPYDEHELDRKILSDVGENK